MWSKDPIHCTTRQYFVALKSKVRDSGLYKKFVICITDAFTKCTVVTLLQIKNAKTVADAIFKEWFCKFGIPAQIHTDGGKEFVNKLAAKIVELLNVAHTKTSPAHPQ